MKKPLVSIVIPSKNEENNIGNCLESIKRQTYPANRIETIVVVNEDSVDKTKEIARKYTKNVFIKGVERSEPRNLGLKKATGKYLIYLDADMIISSSVVEKSVEKLEKEKIVALYVPEVVLGNSYWSRVRRFERSFYDGTVIDCVRIIKKNIYDKTGGFDISLIGPEDWDLDKKVRKIGEVGVPDRYDFKEIDDKLMKINYQKNDLVGQLIQLSSSALIYHNERKFNLKKYLLKKSYYAKSINVYINKWGKDDPDIKKQFGFWYRYLGVFLENEKWKKLLKYPYLVLGMFFLRFLVGLSFLLGGKYFKSKI